MAAGRARLAIRGPRGTGPRQVRAGNRRPSPGRSGGGVRARRVNRPVVRCVRMGARPCCRRPEVCSCPRPPTAPEVVVPTTTRPGSPPSWDDVVAAHSARVYRLAYRLTGNRHDAEDLTQDVFVRVFRSLSSYTPGTFEGWLHRITTNLFLDQVRRKPADPLRRAARRRRRPPRRPRRPPRPRRTTQRTSTTTCSAPWTRCCRTSEPPSCSRHRGTHLRGDRARPWTSSWAPSAAASTAAAASCARRSRTARRRCRPRRPVTAEGPNAHERTRAAPR